MAISVKQVGEAVQGLRTDLGAGLVACDVWAVTDAVSLGGLDSNPAAIALLNRRTSLPSTATSCWTWRAARWWLLCLPASSAVGC